MQRKLHAPCEWGEKPEAESQGLTYPYPINADILRLELSPNSAIAPLECSDFKVGDSGRAEVLPRSQAGSCFSIGAAMENPTTLES